MSLTNILSRTMNTHHNLFEMSRIYVGNDELKEGVAIKVHNGHYVSTHNPTHIIKCCLGNLNSSILVLMAKDLKTKEIIDVKITTN